MTAWWSPPSTWTTSSSAELPDIWCIISKKKLLTHSEILLLYLDGKVGNKCLKCDAGKKCISLHNRLGSLGKKYNWIWEVTNTASSVSPIIVRRGIK